MKNISISFPCFNPNNGLFTYQAALSQGVVSTSHIAVRTIPFSLAAAALAKADWCNRLAPFAAVSPALLDCGTGMDCGLGIASSRAPAIAVILSTGD